MADSKNITVHGICPGCGGKITLRERRPNGNDHCENGHVFPSSGDVPTKTPITAEWLKEMGFRHVYRGLYEKEFAPKSRHHFRVFLPLNAFAICDVDNDVARLPQGPFTTERLSAIWSAITGSEL